jgi:hypothetical protein
LVKKEKKAFISNRQIFTSTQPNPPTFLSSSVSGQLPWVAHEKKRRILMQGSLDG